MNFRSGMNGSKPTVLLGQPSPRIFVRCFNRLAQLLGQGAWKPLHTSELLERASRKTGLTCFGTENFIEPLEVLVHSLNQHHCYNRLGNLYIRHMFFHQYLTNRLFINEAFRQNPDWDHVRIKRPIIVLGLPRSGTTHLFNLLACDPNNRYLTNWEATRPAPPPNKPMTDAQRRAVSTKEIAAWEYLSPSIRQIHHLMPEGPEECTFLLANAFTCLLFPVFFHIPEYVEWIKNHDYRDALSFHRKQLQMHQASRNSQRWLLKSPAFLPAIDAVLETYPDACIIQIHRDPVKTIPSLCSLHTAARMVVGDHIEGKQISEQVTAAWGPALKRYLTDRKKHDGSRIFDAYYQDLMADPVALIQRIYNHFHLPLEDKTRASMAAYINRSRQYQHGPHNYSPEQFHLKADSLRTYFKGYTDQFEIPYET